MLNFCGVHYGDNKIVTISILTIGTQNAHDVPHHADQQLTRDWMEDDSVERSNKNNDEPLAAGNTVVLV
jgi:hypothetical protein